MKKIMLVFMLLVIIGTVSAVSDPYRASEGTDIEITLLNQDPDPVSPPASGQRCTP